MVGQRGVRRWSARWYLVPLTLVVGMLAALGLAAALVRVSYLQDPLPVATGDRLTIALEPVGGTVATSTGSWVHAAATPVGVDAGTYALDCPAESRALYAAHRVAYLEAGLAGLAALLLYLAAVAAWGVLLFARNRPGTPR